MWCSFFRFFFLFTDDGVFALDDLKRSISPAKKKAIAKFLHIMEFHFSKFLQRKKCLRLSEVILTYPLRIEDPSAGFVSYCCVTDTTT